MPRRRSNRNADIIDATNVRIVFKPLIEKAECKEKKSVFYTKPKSKELKNNKSKINIKKKSSKRVVKKN